MTQTTTPAKREQTAAARPVQLKDLHAKPELAALHGEFLNKLNAAPNPNWIKTNQGVKYIPIERIEHLLRTIYQRWEWQVMDYKVIANSICVHGRLRVQEPTTLEWIEMDGLGAVPIQVKSGSNPTAFDAIIPNAVQKNLPAAESFALKDAAEKLGKVFGGDLNRKDEIAFRSVYAEWVNGEAKEESK